MEERRGRQGHRMKQRHALYCLFVHVKVQWYFVLFSFFVVAFLCFDWIPTISSNSPLARFFFFFPPHSVRRHLNFHCHRHVVKLVGWGCYHANCIHLHIVLMIHVHCITVSGELTISVLPGGTLLEKHGILLLFYYKSILLLIFQVIIKP